MAQVLKTFEVPGVAIAIVKDGKVVLAKGYGVRRLGEPTPVDARTQFGIASNTKLFTASALATLVEAGKVEWDAPVIRYLPWFAMYDPFVTRELTIRDLLVHRSGLGLGAGDLLWWPTSTYDRKEIARRLRYIRPATSFRTAYAYDNVLYLVAGEVIEAVSGQSWEDYVRTHILEPLGMAALFIAQAYGVHLSLGHQLTLLGVMMITSKGAAGVTGSGFIVLASTLSALRVVPVEGVALVLGVDRFMPAPEVLKISVVLLPVVPAPPLPSGLKIVGSTG